MSLKECKHHSCIREERLRLAKEATKTNDKKLLDEAFKLKSAPCLL